MEQPITLTPDQHSALRQIQSFINDSNKQVFILKGAAGSGKTTLIKEVIAFLQKERRVFQLMAPTGRAAKILRDKTGVGSTIHRGIYNLNKLESIGGNDVSEKSFHYYFPLNLQTESKVIIVDEASMVSDTKSEHELFTFGSGHLLSDLIEYANFLNKSSKLIFVGDNAQLPPVTDNHSKALDEKYFLEKNLKVEVAELQTIHRQLENSGILQNAKAIRELLILPRVNRNTFIINTNDIDVKEINAEQIASDYVNKFPNPEVGNGVILAFSNEQTKEYNQSVRSKIFPVNPEVTAGDVLIINNNNYHLYPTEIYNGDMGKVIESEQITENKIIPVLVDGVKKQVHFTFRNIIIRLPHFGENISCKIIDSLLNSPNRDLSTVEMKALYIDFCIRFNETQRKLREKGEPYFKEGSEEFRLGLKTDPYFNALRVKYGYAITCHKAQGGEWDTVYVDYSGRIGLYDDALRWCYTATTRAKKELIITNNPNINLLSKLEFSQIGQIGQIDQHYYQSCSSYQTPYHSENSNLGKRLKYFEIIEKIKDTPFSLKKIISNDYLEKYFFDFDGKEIVLDLYHNGAGIFNTLNVSQNSNPENDLKKLINEPFEQKIPMIYHPTNQLFQTLYQNICSVCSENDIQITNVVEKPDNYYVLYFFKTSGKFSMIQFYFTQRKGFTNAITKSDIGKNDEKLQKLINQLN